MLDIARALHIRGWMMTSELYFLAEKASCHKRIVEVGSFCGRSSRALADNTSGELHCVDPWDGMCQVYGIYVHSNGYRKEYNEFEKNLKDHLESGKVKAHKTKYENFWVDYPDMIFIDALHEYKALRDDIFHSLDLMKYGLLCGHDYCDAWPEVAKAVDEIFPNRQVVESIWYVEL